MAHPTDIYVALSDAPAQIEDTFQFHKPEPIRVGPRLELLFDVPASLADCAVLRAEIDQRLTGCEYFYAELLEGEMLFQAGDWRHLPHEAALRAFPSNRKELVVIFDKAYPELEAQFCVRPQRTHREGDRVAMYFDMTKDPTFSFRLEPTGFDEDPYWVEWDHDQLYDELEMTGAIIEDGLDNPDYDWTQSERIAVIAYEDGVSVDGRENAAHLLSGWKFNPESWIAPPTAQAPVAFPDALTHVFVASLDMGEEELDALRANFPVYAIYEKQGARLVHIATHDFGHREDYWNDGCCDLEWPELCAQLGAIGFATDERHGCDDDRDAADRPFVWYSVSGCGSAYDGTDDHPLWDHFGMRVKREFSVTFRP